MKTINWQAATNFEIVVATKDFQLRFVDSMTFDSPHMPFRGKAGYQLVYRPTGHVQAEGVDIVAAVAQAFREQRILDRVKENPSLVTEDPHQGQLESFFNQMDVADQKAN
jgi:hypothetical protein